MLKTCTFPSLRSAARCASFSRVAAIASPRPSRWPRLQRWPLPFRTRIERVVADYDEFVGRFTAVDFVEVRARVSGYLDKVHFTDGQVVKRAICCSPSTGDPSKPR